MKKIKKKDFGKAFYSIALILAVTIGFVRTLMILYDISLSLAIVIGIVSVIIEVLAWSKYFQKRGNNGRQPISA